MTGVKPRSRTLVELADNLVFYAKSGAPPIADDKARAQLTADARALLGRLASALEGENDWSEQTMEDAIRRFAEHQGVKLGQVAQPLRVALSGSTASPGIFEVLSVLGPLGNQATSPGGCRCLGGGMLIGPIMMVRPIGLGARNAGLRAQLRLVDQLVRVPMSPPNRSERVFQWPSRPPR
jgi:hypothetical protein